MAGAHARTSAPACPEELDEAGCGDDVPPALGGLARPSTSAWSTRGPERAAPYALCLGYRIRYVLDLNAREAMQLIELRSGREGHPSYRAVAHEMHAQIAAVHPAVGRGDDPRRPRHRAAAGAHPLRDAHAGQPPARRPLRAACRGLGPCPSAVWRQSPVSYLNEIARRTR